MRSVGTLMGRGFACISSTGRLMSLLNPNPNPPRFNIESSRCTYTVKGPPQTTTANLDIAEKQVNKEDVHKNADRGEKY